MYWLINRVLLRVEEEDDPTGVKGKAATKKRLPQKKRMVIKFV